MPPPCPEEKLQQYYRKVFGHILCQHQLTLRFSKAYIPLRCKTLRVGSLPQFRAGDTNMLVSKNAKICVIPNTNANICVTPKANPQHEPVKYSWCWVPNARGWRWACILHVVDFLFPRVGYPTRTQFSVE